uniref:CG-1 domain-containing protein n=1 Tax=Podarcis muralis TaxID=64176 RepID=A0A670JYD5_PODMU
MNKEATEVSENNHHLKVFLPKKLVECVPKCPALPKERLRWNTNEEIASYLITFEKHEEWLSCSPKTRPQNGSIILYNRKKVKYRKDGYCWKKRKDGKTTREDHMKLKVKGVERHLPLPASSPTCSPSSALPSAVSLRLLRPLVHRPYIPPALLLAAAGILGFPLALPESPLSPETQESGTTGPQSGWFGSLGRGALRLPRGS